MAEVDVTVLTSLLLVIVVQFTRAGPDRKTVPSDYDTDDVIRPIFKQISPNITVAPGGKAVLKCTVENLGTKTVIWRKQDEVHPLTIGLFPFAADTRVTVDFNVRTSEWRLLIQDARPSDEGIYFCQVSTKDGSEHAHSIALHVKTIQISGTEYVERGGDIQLMCNATGRPEPPHDVDWYRGSERIKSDAERGVIVTKNIETRLLVSVLLIQNSQVTDGGEYTCRSTNEETGSIIVHVLNTSTGVGKRGTLTSPERSELSKRNSSESRWNNSVFILFLATFTLTLLRRHITGLFC